MFSKSFPIISIKNVDYIYPNGTHALRNVSLNINKGELIAIMGQNGAGKTTLIRMLNGLLRPSKGSVYIEKKDISSKTIADLSKVVGIVFQNPSHQLFSNTIDDEINFSLKNLELNPEQIEMTKDTILKSFDLLKYQNRSPLNLSGGESKKLAIASIICRDPSILVFDEPTLGQDAKEIKFFIDLINTELDRSKTIIIVTHNVEFTMEHIPRTILMTQGKILADGPTEKILSNELLIKESSLIIPQLFQFKNALTEINLNIPEEIYRESQLINFLDNYLRKIKKVKGDVR
ncbi:MAG: energy-coupling factor ABC transporter ATP-binding protein [Candidatus Hermodarchaeota archaeon]